MKKRYTKKHKQFKRTNRKTKRVQKRVQRGGTTEEETKINTANNVTELNEIMKTIDDKYKNDTNNAEYVKLKELFEKRKIELTNQNVTPNLSTKPEITDLTEQPKKELDTEQNDVNVTQNSIVEPEITAPDESVNNVVLNDETKVIIQKIKDTKIESLNTLSLKINKDISEDKIKEIDEIIKKINVDNGPSKTAEGQQPGQQQTQGQQQQAMQGTQGQPKSALYGFGKSFGKSLGNGFANHLANQNNNQNQNQNNQGNQNQNNQSQGNQNQGNQSLNQGSNKNQGNQGQNVDMKVTGKCPSVSEEMITVTLPKNLSKQIIDCAQGANCEVQEYDSEGKEITLESK